MDKFIKLFQQLNFLGRLARMFLGIPLLCACSAFGLDMPNGLAQNVIDTIPTPVHTSTKVPSETPIVLLLTRIPLAPTSAPSSEPFTTAEECSVTVSPYGMAEPEYVGLSGYLQSPPSFEDVSESLPNYPWDVYLLAQTGPGIWEENGETLPLKTPVIVKQQNLVRENSGRYSGYLVVESLVDSQRYIINRDDFTPVKWWVCSLDIAVMYSPVIARVKDGVRPVNRDGRFADVGEQREVYCYKTPSPSESFGLRNGVMCKVYDQYQYGLGGVDHVFPADGLELVY